MNLQPRRPGAWVLLPVLLIACGSGDERIQPCGPKRATAMRAIDGDTVLIQSGDKVRYLLVDTPELTSDAPGCLAVEARALNVQLVEGREIDLEYDQECRDRYGRLLAYVSMEGRSINALMVQRGYACVLHIPPNGEGRVEEFKRLQETARAERRGMWGVCPEASCPEE